MTVNPWLIPLGFVAEDLGEVGTIEDLGDDDPDCFLISELTSPLSKRTRNTYTILFANNSNGNGINLASWVEDVKWTIYKTSETVDNPNEWKEDETLQLPFVHFEDWEPKQLTILPTECGQIKIKAELIGSSPGQVLRTIIIMQDVKRECHVANEYRKILGNLDNSLSIGCIRLSNERNLALIGNPITTELIIDSYWKYINNAYTAFDSYASSFFGFEPDENDLKKRIPKELFISLLYQILLPLASPDEKIELLNEKNINLNFNFGFNQSDQQEMTTVPAHSLGVFGLRIATICSVVGNEGLEGAPYLESTLFGQSTEDGMLEKEINIVTDAEQNAKIHRDVYLLSKFAKSNTLIAYKLINWIKNILLDATCLDIYEIGILDLNNEKHMRNIISNFIKLNSCALPLSSEELNYEKSSLAFSDWIISLFSSGQIENVFNFSQKVISTIHSPFIELIKSGAILAREVMVYLDNQYPQVEHITKTVDFGLATLTGSNFVESDLEALKHENFGWDPSFLNAYNFKHSLLSSDLIMLDAGFWGHYNRESPKRDFGLIIGHKVFLCSLFCSDSIDERLGIYFETKHLLIKELGEKNTAVKLLKKLMGDWNYTFEIVSFASNNDPPEDVEFNENRMNIVLPDMHLPEKWPDLDPNDTNYDDNDRITLRKLLLGLQLKMIPNDIVVFDVSWLPVGIKNITREHQIAVQNYLKDVLYAHKQGKLNELDKFDFPNLSKSYTAEEFLKEYRYVERKVRIDSSWFYPPADNPNPSLDNNPITRLENTTIDDLKGDPSPAIDLAVFLYSIKHTAESLAAGDPDIELQEAWNKIRVIQVGDLFELWMGREWLYKDFGMIYEDKYLPFSELDEIVNLVTSHGSGFFQEFQYRLDKGWHILNNDQLLPSHKAGSEEDAPLNDTLLNGDGELIDDSIKMLICNKWPEEFYDKRYYTGFSLTEDFFNDNTKLIIKRSIERLLERIKNIEDFSLPEVVLSDPRNNAFQKLQDLDLDLRSHVNEYGQTEYYWNLLIIDLFRKFGDYGAWKYINGNHDGYMGDPLLNGMFVGELYDHIYYPERFKEWFINLNSIWSEFNIEDRIKLFNTYAKSWYSNDGIWAEHGHRWDLYNFDGAAMGAAITNLAHYNMRPIIQWMDDVKGLLFPTFHKETIPMIAQWFIVANSKNYNFSTSLTGDIIPTNSDIQDYKVKPFGISANGHTHSRDLLRITIHKEGT